MPDTPSGKCPNDRLTSWFCKWKVDEFHNPEMLLNYVELYPDCGQKLLLHVVARSQKMCSVSFAAKRPKDNFHSFPVFHFNLQVSQLYRLHLTLRSLYVACRFSVGETVVQAPRIFPCCEFHKYALETEPWHFWTVRRQRETDLYIYNIYILNWAQNCLNDGELAS